MEVNGVTVGEVGNSNFKDEYVRLDVHTELEHIIMKAGFLFGLAAIALRNTSIRRMFELSSTSTIPPFLAGIGVLLAVVRLLTDCTYFLSNKEKLICYSFAFMGNPTTYKVASFSEVTRVGVEIYVRRSTGTGPGRRSTIVGCVVIELNNSIRFRITEEHTNLPEVAAYGRKLAEHLGAEFVSPENEKTSLAANDAEIPKLERHVAWGSGTDFIQIGAQEIILLVVAICFFIAVDGFTLF